MSARNSAQLKCPAVRVFLVRHGETDHNVNGIIQGSLDTQLNAEGLKQAALTANTFLGSGIVFEKAYSSDLQRASKTAEIILSKQANPVPLELDERIRERFLGKLQGNPRPKSYSEKEMGCELYPDLTARLLDFWDSLFPPLTTTPSLIPSSLLRPSEPPAKGVFPSILIVSHGASLRTLTEAVLINHLHLSVTDPRGMPKRPHYGNCSITEVVMWDTGREGRKRWKGEISMLCADGHLYGSEIKEATDDLAEDGQDGAVEGSRRSKS